MNKDELDKILDNHKLWLSSGEKKGERADLSYADLRNADLRNADLRNADLSYADLRYADLRYADLDYSSFPLWCGGLQIDIDDKIAIQLLYHTLSNIKYSKYVSESLKNLLKIKSLVNEANKFHKVFECGKIEDGEV